MAKKTAKKKVSRPSLKGDIRRHPYVANIATHLEYYNPGSTLFDLRDELNQCLEVVEKLMSKYGENSALAKDTPRPRN